MGVREHRSLVNISQIFLKLSWFQKLKILMLIHLENTLKLMICGPQLIKPKKCFSN